MRQLTGGNILMRRERHLFFVSYISSFLIPLRKARGSFKVPWDGCQVYEQKFVIIPLEKP